MVYQDAGGVISGSIKLAEFGQQYYVTKPWSVLLVAVQIVWTVIWIFLAIIYLLIYLFYLFIWTSYSEDYTISDSKLHSEMLHMQIHEVIYNDYSFINKKLEIKQCQ